MDGDGCATRTMCARGNTRLQKLHDHGHEVFRRRWTPRAPRHGVRREVIEGHVDAKWVLIACLFRQAASAGTQDRPLGPSHVGYARHRTEQTSPER